MRNLTTNAGRQPHSICLQHETCMDNCGCLRFGSEGVVFRSPRELELMADFSVRIECPAGGCECQTLSTEGIVVGCEKCSDGFFEITVLFLEQTVAASADNRTPLSIPVANPFLN